ncbi:MAG: nitrogenase [Leptolyngbyaceae cyanobacterium SL_5_9]|nr:nitrogenase [Leptolyngbyaceae cyanobacterium SL_5_9]NJO73667.1 nitrogenase [Leptolyngbyaceae cyanobacterium RM1_406_9]
MLKYFDLWNPIRQFLDAIEIRNPQLARLVCRTIPSHCPFERDVNCLGYHLRIPPLCKLNPLYEQVAGLRFKCLSFLADQCGEDVTQYC